MRAQTNSIRRRVRPVQIGDGCGPRQRHGLAQDHFDSVQQPSAAGVHGRRHLVPAYRERADLATLAEFADWRHFGRYLPSRQRHWNSLWIGARLYQWLHVPREVLFCLRYYEWQRWPGYNAVHHGHNQLKEIQIFIAPLD